MNSIHDTTDFDRFFAAYVRAALWSTSGEHAAIVQGRPEDTSLDSLGCAIDSLAPATRETMLADCAKFWQSQSALVLSYNYDTRADIEQAGHDFWITRNRHGAGSWDSPEIWGEENAEALTNAAHEFPEVDLYIGDDGLIYQCPA
jgi:hypothetical protein